MGSVPVVVRYGFPAWRFHFPGLVVDSVFGRLRGERPPTVSDSMPCGVSDTRAIMAAVAYPAIHRYGGNGNPETRRVFRDSGQLRYVIGSALSTPSRTSKCRYSASLPVTAIVWPRETVSPCRTFRSLTLA